MTVKTYTEVSPLLPVVAALSLTVPPDMTHLRILG
jgi:hypothetical protein